jgi:hypothetical protein
MTLAETPQLLVGMSVDQAGLQQGAQQTGKLADVFSRMELSVGNISKVIDGLGGKLLGLAGVAGIGAFVKQMAAAETSAVNTALALNSVTGGRSGFTGLQMSGAQYQVGTGIQLGQSLGALGSYAGMTGRTPSFGSVVPGMGMFSQAYGMSIGATAALSAGTTQALGGGNSNSILNQYAQVAGKFGMPQQTGIQAQTALGLQQIGLSGVGINPAQNIGLRELFTNAFADALAKNDQRFAGTAGAAQTQAAFGQVQSYLQGAFTNPQQESFLTMAGISPQAQLAGLTGPQGAQTLQKLIGHANSAFGKNSITEEEFLMSMMGPQAANAIADFNNGKGGKTALDQLLGALTGTSSGPTANEKLRQKQAQSTLAVQGSKLQGLTQVAGAGAAGLPLGAQLALGALGMGVGAKGLGLVRGLFGGGGEVATSTGGEAAVGASDAGGAAMRALLGSSASSATGSLAGAGAGAAESAGAELASGSALGPWGIAGVAAAQLGGMVIDPASAGLAPLSGAAFAKQSSKQETAVVAALVAQAKSKFGSNWQGATSRKWMNQQLSAPSSPFLQATVVQNGDMAPSAEHPWATQQMLQQFLSAAPNTDDKFAQAVNKFVQAIDTATSGKGLKGAAYTGGGSMQNAAWFGPAGVNGVASSAPGMVLASLDSSGGGAAAPASAGNGSIPAAYTTPASGGASGSGWQPCTLTWYDPALGGTNSSNGAKNPSSATASGQPYSASAMTCAAPPAYAFGTQIQFSYNGASVTCTVNDRGVAITGSHFDLSRGAANALGMLSAGHVSAQFKVVSSGSGSASPSSGGASGSAGSGSGAVPIPSGGGTPTAVMASAMAPLSSVHASPQYSEGASGLTVNIDSRRVAQYQRLVGRKV